MSYTEFIVDLANKSDKAKSLANTLKGNSSIDKDTLKKTFGDAGYDLSDDDAGLLAKNWGNLHELTSSQY